MANQEPLYDTLFKVAMYTIGTFIAVFTAGAILLGTTMYVVHRTIMEIGR